MTLRLGAHEIQELCSLYAGLLGLTPAWSVRARYALPGEIRAGSVGELKWARGGDGAWTADILIDPVGTHDHEVTLVHELCHIPLLDSPPRGRRSGKAQEAAIDQFASALVRQRRRQPSA